MDSGVLLPAPTQFYRSSRAFKPAHSIIVSVLRLTWFGGSRWSANDADGSCQVIFYITQESFLCKGKHLLSLVVQFSRPPIILTKQTTGPYINNCNNEHHDHSSFHYHPSTNRDFSATRPISKAKEYEKTADESAESTYSRTMARKFVFPIYEEQTK